MRGVGQGFLLFSYLGRGFLLAFAPANLLEGGVDPLDLFFVGLTKNCIKMLGEMMVVFSVDQDYRCCIVHGYYKGLSSCAFVGDGDNSVDQ